MERCRQQFLAQGYTVLAQALPAGLIDQHLAAVAGVMTKHGATHNTLLADWPRGRQEALQVDLAALDGEDSPSHRLSMHPAVQDSMRAIFGDEPVRSSTRTALWEFGNRSAHFDTTFVSTTPLNQVARAWCALDDIHPDSGIFYVVPGTHGDVRQRILDDALVQHPEFVELLERLAADRETVLPEFHRRVWPYLCERMVGAIVGRERISFAPGKGDVVLFSPNVIHGTLPRTNPSLPRKTMISEWRGKSATIYFASEHFGAGHDRRICADAGQSASHGAVRTKQGLIGVPYP